MPLNILDYQYISISESSLYQQYVAQKERTEKEHIKGWQEKYDLKMASISTAEREVLIQNLESNKQTTEFLNRWIEVKVPNRADQKHTKLFGPISTDTQYAESLTLMEKKYKNFDQHSGLIALAKGSTKHDWSILALVRTEDLSLSISQLLQVFGTKEFSNVNWHFNKHKLNNLQNTEASIVCRHETFLQSILDLLTFQNPSNYALFFHSDDSALIRDKNSHAISFENLKNNLGTQAYVEKMAVTVQNTVGSSWVEEIDSKQVSPFLLYK